VHDDAWRPETRLSDRHLMHAWLLPNTTKNQGGISDTHQGEMSPYLLASIILDDIIIVSDEGLVIINKIAASGVIER
jgi:hypothetical protein